MSLVRFCSTWNKVNCISSVVGRNQVAQASWLAASADLLQVNKRDYHRQTTEKRSSPSSRHGAEKHALALEQQQFFSQHRAMSSQQPPGTVGQRDPLDTGFANPIAAFKSKTLMELIRAYVVYMICSSSYLVENNMKVSSVFWCFLTVF